MAVTKNQRVIIFFKFITCNYIYRLQASSSTLQKHANLKIHRWRTGWTFSFQSSETFLNVHWMLTEWSLKFGFKALFSEFLVSIQSHWTLVKNEIRNRAHGLGPIQVSLFLYFLNRHFTCRLRCFVLFVGECEYLY